MTRVVEGAGASAVRVLGMDSVAGSQRGGKAADCSLTCAWHLCDPRLSFPVWKTDLGTVLGMKGAPTALGL